MATTWSLEIQNQSKPNQTKQRESIETMIRNVYGKAVTASTVITFLGMNEEDTSTISRKDMATVALALRNTQGKEKDEEEALGYVHRLRDRCERELPGFTQGLIYNAIGTNVHVKIVRDVDWEEDKCWESVREAIQNTCPLHKANQEGWYSIITASYGPQASFETILTLQHL